MDEVENGEPEIRNFHEREHDKKNMLFILGIVSQNNPLLKKNI